MIPRASEPSCQFCRGQKILIEQAIEKQICRGKERPAERGWVIVVTDRDVIAPHQQANRRRVVPYPGIVETQNRIEMRIQPLCVSALIADEQPQLTENRLGLVSRQRILAQDSKGVRVVCRHHDGDPATRGSMLEKVQETSRDMFTQLLFELTVLTQCRKSKKSLTRPERVPIPKVGGIRFARQTGRDAGMLQDARRISQEFWRNLRKIAK